MNPGPPPPAPHPPAPSAPGSMRGFEHLFKRLARYPLATLQVVLFLLVAWGVVGGELGAGDLFWHEHGVQQFFVGGVVCLLFGTVLFVTILLLPPREMPGAPLDDRIGYFDDTTVPPPDWVWRLLGWLRLRPVWVAVRSWCPTLLPDRDPGVRRVGGVLFRMLVVLLVVLYAGKRIAVIAGSWTDSMREAEVLVQDARPAGEPADAPVRWSEKVRKLEETPTLKAARVVFAEQGNGQPFVGGYLTALLLGFGVGLADAKAGWRERLARHNWFRRGFNHPGVLIPTDPELVPLPRSGRYLNGTEVLALAVALETPADGEIGTPDGTHPVLGAHELCAVSNLRALLRLHAAAVVFAGLIFVLLVIALLLTGVLSSHSPVVLIGLLLILLTMLGGFAVFRFPYYRLAALGFVAYLCVANMSAGAHVPYLFALVGGAALLARAPLVWAGVGLALVWAAVGGSARGLPDEVVELTAVGTVLAVALVATAVVPRWGTEPTRWERNLCRGFGWCALVCLGFGNRFGCQTHPATYDAIGWTTDAGAIAVGPAAYDRPRGFEFGGVPGPRADLICSQFLLETHGAVYTANGRKPRLVLVAVSGGGIRAAVWTAVVLEGLERELAAEGFADRVRIITGASGGMVGAAAYVARDPLTGQMYGPVDEPDGALCATTGLSRLAGSLARDSLSPVAQTMILRDFTWNTLFPNRYKRERGRTLEQAWATNFTTDCRPDEDSCARFLKCKANPFARPMRELAAFERACARPSLIFAPIMVEDTKRLLVSNLDLAPLTVPAAHRLDLSAAREGAPLSRAAVEFFRLFPNSDGFAVGSAARMSASFPVVSPAVPLPTNPVRRVVDAGYFDNYGIDVLTNWLLHNEKAVREHTSGVLLVQVRAYPLEKAGQTFEDGTEGALDLLIGAVSAPLAALANARGSAAYHRNNQQLAEVNRVFNQPAVDAAGKPAPNTRPFFATTVFELQQNAALSWYLTSAQKRQIAAGFYKYDPDARAFEPHPDKKNRPGHFALDPIVDQNVQAIRDWFQKP